MEPQVAGLKSVYSASKISCEDQNKVYQEVSSYVEPVPAHESYGCHSVEFVAPKLNGGEGRKIVRESVMSIRNVVVIVLCGLLPGETLRVFGYLKSISGIG